MHMLEVPCDPRRFKVYHPIFYNLKNGRGERESARAHHATGFMLRGSWETGLWRQEQRREEERECVWWGEVGRKDLL